MPQTWQASLDALTAKRAALNEEIAAYPGPITGCDAQFNHLLEQRKGMNAELARLMQMGSDVDEGTLKQFIEASAFLRRPGADAETG